MMDYDAALRVDGSRSVRSSYVMTFQVPTMAGLLFCAPAANATNESAQAQTKRMMKFILRASLQRSARH